MQVHIFVMLVDKLLQWWHIFDLCVTDGAHVALITPKNPAAVIASRLARNRN